MEQFQIETAQNIRINQNTAYLGDRILAYLIDALIIGSYYIVIFWLLFSIDVNFGDQWAFFLMLALPAFLYFFLMETFMDGKTIGKKFMKIRVVKLDGTKPGMVHYFIRWILRIIDITMSNGGVAVLTILITGKGQRIGDIAAGTTVISEKKRTSLKDTLMREIPADYKPTYPQVTIFKDDEMQTIKELYDNAKRNGDYNVILSLSNRIKEVMQVTTNMLPLDFVDIVIKDYNFYTQH